MRTASPLANVFDRMVTLSRAMDQAFPANNGHNLTRWTPAVDAVENDHAYVVTMDLPGLAPGDVDVTFDRNTLTVTGNRQAAQAEENARAFYAERVSGAFERSLRFPQHVDSDKISATFANGVLTITVPKAESAKSRKIAVN